MVYLDQSYLSSMAKEAAGETRPSDAAYGRTMGCLLSLLRDAVDRDLILCPSSLVQSQEIGLDSRLENKIWNILQELSDSMSFYSYREIEFAQAVRALHHYLGRAAEPEDGRWQHAFPKNPHRQIERPRVYVHIPWRSEFAEDDRSRKERIQAFRRDQLDQLDRNSLTTYSECQRRQLLGVVQYVYVDPLKEYLRRIIGMITGSVTVPSLNEASSFRDLIEYLEFITPPYAFNLFREYCDVTGFDNSIPDERYWRFFESPNFAAIPYYDIFCSMEAGFVFYRPGRKPKASDPYDLAALSSVLPYVDIVTTDRTMKDMVIQLGLDTKYGAEVFSASQPDVEVLIQRLTEITKGQHR